MPSINSMMTGLSGLLASTRRLDVIGNNIANVNTTAFKANRVQFSALYGMASIAGSSAVGSLNGPNPAALGMGTMQAGASRSFLQGTIAGTGIATDMAIQGEGFFVVQNQLGIQYTRDGGFLLDASGNLVTRSGFLVQGYGVDASGNVIQGGTSSINIPLGTLSIAATTGTVGIGGILDAGGDVAAHGSRHESQTFWLDAAMTQPAVGDEDLTTTTLWVDDGTGTAVVAFDPASSPRSITVSGVTKGGEPVEARTFAIGDVAVAGTDAFGLTLNDFADFLNGALGLDDTTVNGQALGGGASFQNGQLVVVGNEGTVQDLGLVGANVVVNNQGAGAVNPFDFTRTQDADGESVRTTISVYDSLGRPTLLDVTFVLESRDADGATTWQMLVEDNDPAVWPRVIQVGSVTFDGSGNLTGVENASFTVPQGVAPGAGPGIPVTIDLANALGPLRALDDSASSSATVFNDGAPPGTLSQFGVDDYGQVVGGFTNGLTRVLGQLAIARFPSNDGLADMGNNQFGATVNSGDPIVGTALTSGMGAVVGGALEQSNVDLSREFVDMVQATTGFSASSRVISTADQMIQTLLGLGG